MDKLLPLILLLCAAAPATEPSTNPSCAPTDSYDTRQLDGWSLRLSRDFAASPDSLALLGRVLDLLHVKLFDITRAVPPKALAELRKVPVWVELNDRGFRAMCYHPSPQWLRSNGYNPDKAGGIEICHADQFLA